jgi:hypothetical protein
MLLSIQQFSQSGVGSITLAFYTSVVLINSLSPLAMVIILRNQENRLTLSRLTQRVLIFDSCCDLIYASLPLINLLVKFFRLFVYNLKNDFEYVSLSMVVHSRYGGDDSKGLCVYSCTSKQKGHNA